MADLTTPNERGARSESAVAAALVRSGAKVFLPAFGADGRVDLVYERGGQMFRVQCKTARRSGGSLLFRTCSNPGNAPIAYYGEIDEFGVYSPDTGVVYIVPVDQAPTRACALRLEPARNGQHAGVRWADTYALGTP